MSAPRVRGLSTRVSNALYTALCDRARREGLTLCCLVANLLGEAEPITDVNPPPASSEALERDSSRNITEILDDIENLERWRDLFLHLLKQLGISLEAAPCPECGSSGLSYFEDQCEEEPMTFNGFRCRACNWIIAY